MKRILKLFLLPLLLCLTAITQTVYAQGGGNEIRFEHFTTAQGLSGNWIRGGMVQDRRGFLWIATSEGLNRYDGYEFKVYQHDENNPNSLSHNSIRAIAEDANGVLWLGTKEGLNKFDSTTETFTHYTHDPNDPTTLSDNDVRKITIDQTGIIWLGTKAGLNRFDPLTETVTRYQHNPADPTSLGGNNVRAILADSAGTLWIGARDGGLHRFDPSTPLAGQAPATETFIHYRHNPDDPTSLSDDTVTALYEDANGGLWVGTENGGLNKFDRTTETFIPYRHYSANPKTLSDDYIQIIAPVQGEPGNLWLGTDSGGLNKLDTATGTVTRYQHNPLTPDSLSDNDVMEIFTDRAGVVWVGTRNGLNKYAPLAHQFTYYTQQADTTNTLSDNLIQAIYQDENSVLWLGTRAGLNRFDRANNTITHYRHNPDNLNSLPDDDVETIAPGKPGVLWLGYSGAGLTRFDVDAETFTHYRPDENNPHSIPPDTIARNGIRRAVDGTIWLVMKAGDLVKLDPATEIFTTYQHDPDNPNSLSKGGVEEMLANHEGVLWLKSGNVLTRFDPTTETFTHYVYNTDDPEFATLTQDQTPEDVLWVRANVDLIKFDPATERFIRDSETERWTGKAIGRIIADSAGLYWLRTEDGLVRFNPQTGVQTVYDERDGLLGYDRAWFFNEKTGELFVSGAEARGFYAFYPDQLQPQTYLSPVVLTNFQRFNEDVPIGGDSPLRQAIFETSALTLAYNDNFSFEFAALDYTGPQYIQYQYKLDGLEEHWASVDHTRRFAAYTHLPAGNYTFRVRATNGHGQWSDQEVALPVTITPPWWETLWFQAILMGAVAGLLYSGYRWRVWRVEQRNRQLAAQVAARTQELRVRTQELEESEARFRGLSNSTFEAVVIHEQGQILDANQTTVEMFGYSRAELLGKHINDLMISESQQFTAQQIQVETEEAYELEGLTKEGTVIPLEVRAKAAPYQGRQVRVVAARDLTERKQIEAQKQRLTAMEERERIGRELHDDLGQVMGYVSLQAQAAREFLNHDQIDRARTTLTQLVQAAREAHSDVRQYILGIRTVTQPASGFFEELDQYLRQFHQRYGLDVQVSRPDDLHDSPMSSEVETQLLRIIQEALTNVRKHACVEVARLFFTLHPDEIQVIIADEGGGFDLGVRSQGLGVRSQGLEVRSQELGIREKGESLSENIQRVESVAESHRSGDAHLSDDQELSQRGKVRPDSADEKSGRINSIEHRLGMGTGQHQRVHPLSGRGEGIADGVGDSTDYRGETGLSTEPTVTDGSTTDRTSGQNAQRVDNQPEKQGLGVRSQGPGARNQGLGVGDKDAESLTPSPQPPTPSPQPLAPSPQPLAPSPQPLAPNFGLEIMRERAEAIGGSLEVRSSPDEGTQVIVCLPRVLEKSPEKEVRGLRVLLVDDHPLYLEGLRNMLSTRGIQVVGLAHDGLEAQKLARKLLPDLILMDVEMPRCNGLEATQRIKADLPDTKIVMLTVAADDETLFEALKYGASGYLLKNLDSRQFFTLLTEVMRGETVLSPSLAARVLTEFAQRGLTPAAEDEETPPTLTIRQREVLELVTRGLTNKEIAKMLHLSRDTVKYHITQILERLQLKSRYELAQYARQQGLTDG